MRYPSFEIDGKRLRELRKARGFTQADMGRRISAVMCPGQDEESATAVYRYIEKHGSTSKDRAQLIADILEVALEDLQGLLPPEPGDYERRILGQLRAQLQRGDNPLLQARLQHSLERHKSESPDDVLELLARHLAARIEGAQLCRNPDELSELTQLTGLPEEELLRPANIDGHWFIAAFGPGVDSVQILSGTYGTCFDIEKLVAEQLSRMSTDAIIRLRRDPPWYRIEIALPWRHETIRINIVRCQPDTNGVRWIQSSWSEQWWMEDFLVNWARRTANFVQTFESPLVPGDFRNLRLRVTEYNGLAGEVQDQTVIRRDFTDLDPRLFDSVQSTGQTHQLAVSWLSSELEEWMAPLLAKFPARYWTISAGNHVAISLYAPVTAPEEPSGLRYQIELVEEIAPGEYVTAAFREADRAALVDRVKIWLK